MFQEDFSRRLCQLRESKGVSARDMSLSVGQNPGYINSIENGKALPSMSAFFMICDFLELSPGEFFDLDSKAPDKLKRIIHHLKRLDEEQLSSIEIIVAGLARNS